MRTALPSPRFIANQTAERRRKRAEMRARVRDKTFMGITNDLGMACGEALNQAVACTPRMRQLYRQRPEVRADLRRRWRRAFEQARARQREVSILEARTDPNAFVEYVARGAAETPPAPAWQDHLAKALPGGLVLAPVGAGMSRQLSSWRTNLQAMWLSRYLAEHPGARVSVVSTSEASAAQLIAATKRSWDSLTRGS